MRSNATALAYAHAPKPAPRLQATYFTTPVLLGALTLFDSQNQNVPAVESKPNMLTRNSGSACHGQSAGPCLLLVALYKPSSALVQGKPVAKRVVVVTPSTLTQNWAAEVQKWLGAERCKALVMQPGIGAESQVRTLLPAFAAHVGGAAGPWGKEGCSCILIKSPKGNPRTYREAPAALIMSCQR